jgi:hypothetical protein
VHLMLFRQHGDVVAPVIGAGAEAMDQQQSRPQGPSG